MSMQNVINLEKHYVLDLIALDYIRAILMPSLNITKLKMKI